MASFATKLSSLSQRDAFGTGLLFTFYPQILRNKSIKIIICVNPRLPGAVPGEVHQLTDEDW